MALTLERPPIDSRENEDDQESSNEKLAFTSPSPEMQARAEELRARKEELLEEFKALREFIPDNGVPSDSTFDRFHELRAKVLQEFGPASDIFNTINLELSRIERLKEFKERNPVPPTSQNGSNIPLPTDPDEDEEDYAQARRRERADIIHAGHRSTEHTASNNDGESAQREAELLDTVGADEVLISDVDAELGKVDKIEPILPSEPKPSMRDRAAAVGDKLASGAGRTVDTINNNPVLKRANDVMPSFTKEHDDAAKELPGKVGNSLKQNVKENLHQVGQDLASARDAGMTAGKYFVDGELQGLKNIGGAGKKAASYVFDGEIQGVANIAKTTKAAGEYLVDGEVQGIQNLAKVGANAARYIAEGEIQGAQNLAKAGKSFITTEAKGVKNITKGARAAGEYVVEGEAQGIQNIAGMAVKGGKILAQGEAQGVVNIAKGAVKGAKILGEGEAQGVANIAKAGKSLASTEVKGVKNIAKAGTNFAVTEAKGVKNIAMAGTNFAVNEAKGVKNIAMAGANFGVTEAKGVRNIGKAAFEAGKFVVKGEAKGVKNITRAATFPVRKMRGGSGAEEQVEPTLPPIEKPRRSPPPPEDDPVAYKFRTEGPKSEEPKAEGSRKPEDVKPPEPEKPLTEEEKARVFWAKIGLDPDMVEAQYAAIKKLPTKLQEGQLAFITQEINKAFSEYNKKQREAAAKAASEGDSAEKSDETSAEKKSGSGEKPKPGEKSETEKLQRDENIQTYADQIQVLWDQLPASISKDLIAYRDLKKPDINGNLQNYITHQQDFYKGRHIAADAINDRVLLDLKEIWVNLLNDFQRVRPGWAGHVELQQELEQRLQGNHVRRLGQAEYTVRTDVKLLEAEFATQDKAKREKLVGDAVKNDRPAAAEAFKQFMTEISTPNLPDAQLAAKVTAFNNGKHPEAPINQRTIIQIGNNENLFAEIIRNNMGELIVRTIAKDKALKENIPPQDELVNVDESYVGRRVQEFDMKYLAGPAMGFGRDVSVFVKMDSGAIMRLSPQGDSGRIYVQDAAHPGNGSYMRPRPKDDAEDEFELGRLEIGKQTTFLTDAGPQKTGNIKEIVIVYTNSHDLLPKQEKKKRDEATSTKPQLSKSDIISKYNAVVQSANESNRRPRRGG